MIEADDKAEVSSTDTAAFAVVIPEAEVCGLVAPDAAEMETTELDCVGLKLDG